jgi:hypothetical protein
MDAIAIIGRVSSLHALLEMLSLHALRARKLSISSSLSVFSLADSMQADNVSLWVALSYRIEFILSQVDP